ncbi:MAG: RNA pseudouridine synthase, partial [Gammaproteobacteria bacterium CG_4_9_14_3_um_filter_38_9]
MKKITLSKMVPDTLANTRLDIALTQLFPDYSRSQLQQWIKKGSVKINDVVVLKQRQTVQMNQVIAIDADLIEQTELKPESIPLSIVYEDDALLVINKPVGLIVHPGAGNPDHTLVNALL